MWTSGRLRPTSRASWLTWTLPRTSVATIRRRCGFERAASIRVSSSPVSSVSAGSDTCKRSLTYDARSCQRRTMSSGAGGSPKGKCRHPGRRRSPSPSAARSPVRISLDSASASARSSPAGARQWCATSRGSSPTPSRSTRSRAFSLQLASAAARSRSGTHPSSCSSWSS